MRGWWDKTKSQEKKMEKKRRNEKDTAVIYDQRYMTYYMSYTL